MSGVALHEGGCHCGAVRWTVKAKEIVDGIKCNCSICAKKQNNHFIVSSDCFNLLQGEDVLTTYTFNTGAAKHRFCSKCGVQSFYIPRSNPHDVAVMPHCIDSPTLRGINWTSFDGQNWEDTMQTEAPVAWKDDKQEK